MVCDPSTFPEMEALQSVASSLRVTLTLRGSAVRRWAAALTKTSRRQNAPPTLFDVAPFVSDIDISHSGPPEQTALLQRRIWEAVPFSECFRWQIHDREQAALFANAASANSIIPANLIEIKDGVLTDPWGGLDDISAGSYRFMRNAHYRSSPLFQRGQDLEIFGALLYFRLLLDSEVTIPELTKQPGTPEAHTIIRDASTNDETATRLREHGYLRMRLHYLLSALLTTVPGNQRSELIGLLRLRPLMEFVGDLLVSGEPAGRRVVTISAHLAGDSYRLPGTTSAWSLEFEALDQFNAALERVRRPDSALWARPGLADGQRLLAASPVLAIQSGKSPSENQVDYETRPTTCEFLHFAVPVRSYDLDMQFWFRDYGSHSPDMAAIGFCTSAETGTLPFFPPSQVSLRMDSDGRVQELLLRINCGMLFRNVTAEQSPSVQFFVIGRRP